MNTDDAINLNEEKNTKYSNVSDLLKYSGSFLKDMFERNQKLSLFIKKLKLVEDPKYFESRNKEYAKLLLSCKMKIEKIIKKTILYSNIKDKKNQKEIDFDIKDFKSITDFVDDLLEKISDSIDIIKGKKKDKKDADIEEELKNIHIIKNKKSGYQENFHLKNKLEVTFDNFDIDNSYYPFIPKIKTKYHQIKELIHDIPDARRLRNENSEKFKNFKFENRKECKDVEVFQHPYREEVNHLMKTLEFGMERINDSAKMLYKTNETTLEWINVLKFEKVSISHFIANYNFKIINYEEIQKASAEYDTQKINFFQNFFFNSDIKDFRTENLLTQYEVEYLPLDQSRFIYVDTVELFNEMLNEIESYAKEISVDLEHHSQESYLGITCLMQISTRFTDYIVDTIKLRPHIQELNRIFCDPKIVKVLHGADYDIEWLQKDFGVYIVNMFDTGQAARILNLPGFSLASLLSTYCNVLADKKYQLADWRIRPLPAEMIKYAREDTHYLLYIYDCLRKKLIQKSLMKNDDPTLAWLLVCKKSNELTLKQYTKPLVKSMDYYQILSRNSHLNKRQMTLLKLFYKFRDFVARKMDLSPHLVLTQKNMFNLVKLPELNADTIYLNLDKNNHIKNYVTELLKLIEQKLIRNEQKIEEGTFTKYLENNYMKNIRVKLNESKVIVNKITVKLPKTSSPVGLNEFKQSGNKIKFAEKTTSKLFQNASDEMVVESSNISEYDGLVDKFSNFNIISFLQEKHPKLKVQIEQPKKVVMSTQVVPKTKPDHKEEYLFSSKAEETLLKHKRKADDKVLDLTDCNRPYNNKGLDDDGSSDESDNEKNIVNETKNIKESENFIKNLMSSANIQRNANKKFKK